MFTGLIEELGEIAAVVSLPAGVRLRVAAPLVANGIANGDSIAVNGVCLTAVDVEEDAFSADVSPETLAKSTLVTIVQGERVNLERAVTPSTRLGGHIVQGHVDARGTFIGAKDEGGFWTVKIGFPTEMRRYLVYKGSVSVEGISLTIAELTNEHFEIAVIPKTWAMTNLSSLRPGDPVNLEADVIAKYVESILRHRDDNN